MARRPKTPIIRPDEIPCPHGDHSSGWNKQELIKIHGNHDLKCQNAGCKGTAIRVRTGSFSLDPLTPKAEAHSTGVVPGPKPKYTPYQKRGKNAVDRNPLVLQEVIE